MIHTFYRKSDSVAFPTNTLPITVSNLIGFILINLEQQPLLKLHTMWTICTQIKVIHFYIVTNIYV